VGMFWYIPDQKLFIGHEDTATLSEIKRTRGENWNKYKLFTALRAHFAQWKFYNNKYVHKPEITNYMYYPRGRVTYLVQEDVYEIRLDKCLAADSSFCTMLKEIYGLTKVKVIFLPDPIDEGGLRYICNKCNKGVGKTETRL
jgi:hypothetical protein